MKKYILENEVYPEELKELSPTFIDSLPLDPYSEEEFKINKNSKLIYSIGKNLTDERGIDDGIWYMMDDPVFSYDFAVTEIYSDGGKKCAFSWSCWSWYSHALCF